MTETIVTETIVSPGARWRRRDDCARCRHLRGRRPTHVPREVVGTAVEAFDSERDGSDGVAHRGELADAVTDLASGLGMVRQQLEREASITPVISVPVGTLSRTTLAAAVTSAFVLPRGIAAGQGACRSSSRSDTDEHVTSYSLL